MCKYGDFLSEFFAFWFAVSSDKDTNNATLENKHQNPKRIDIELNVHLIGNPNVK